MTESLTETKIQDVVEESCHMTEERWSPSSSTQSLSSPQQPLLRFRRISNKGDWDSVSQLMHINDSSNNSNNQHVSTCETLDRVHGIFVTSQDSTFCIGFCTFYLSYSTWDGRVIFLDRLEVGSPPQDALSPLASHSLLSLSLRYTLADIGLKLECSRFVWQHLVNTAPIFPNVQPATLHEWVTIHMDRDAIIRLATTTSPSTASFSEATTGSLDAIIQSCLIEHRAKDPAKKLRLRLATEQDLPTLERLVRGLADFEREPNAVHVTQEHYRRDGFPAAGTSAHPLFYCLLLEDTATNASCGMAFVYVAHSISLGGKFVYLEDLFIEEEYRGLGGGKAVMEALACICIALGCKKFVWQALDWNTPALNFYANIGGKVQEGLLTSRFAGEALKEFCKRRLIDC